MRGADDRRKRRDDRGLSLRVKRPCDSSDRGVVERRAMPAELHAGTVDVSHRKDGRLAQAT